ncbi:MAG: hypothetical protein V1663_02270 [archaeon]
MKKIFLIFLLFFIFNIVSAQDIIITKETATEANLNDILEIKINILNNYQSTRTLEISEKLPDNILLIYPESITETKYYNGIRVNFLKWNINIEPGQVSTVSYKIKPLQLGTYTLSQTTARDIFTTDTFTSNSLSFKINCVPNNLCDSNENYLTCPIDCRSGSKDGICDSIPDSVCDSDCLKSNDSDCKSSFNYLWLIIGIGVIILIIGLIFIFRKKE